MRMRNLVRGAVGFIGVAICLIGLGFLFAPLVFAPLFYIEPVGSQGLASIRADFSGFFIGGGLFALIGAWTGRARPLVVPMVLLAIALFGRFVSLIVDGMGPGAILPMVAEAVMLAILYAGWQNFEKRPL
jgi:hypothetical protein